MPATTTKRKRGRPRKPDREKRRNNVTIRMRDFLKERLQKSALESGRSLSEEIEFQLEGILIERRFFGGDRGYEAARLLFAEITRYENLSETTWIEDELCNLVVINLADDFFTYWGPNGPEYLQTMKDKVREIIYPGVSQDVEDEVRKIVYPGRMGLNPKPPKDKKKKRASKPSKK